MNSTIPKRHAGMLRNWNVPFQSKNRNGDRNGIDNYAFSQPICFIVANRELFIISVQIQLQTRARMITKKQS